MSTNTLAIIGICIFGLTFVIVMAQGIWIASRPRIEPDFKEERLWKLLYEHYQNPNT